MIIFRKAGNFYSVFDDDAFILNSLFHYKIKDGRVGFPINSIDKVTNKLKELHIDFRLDNVNTHFDDNKYDYYLIESKNKISLAYKIDDIIGKINSADSNQLRELIELIDHYFDEKR